MITIITIRLVHDNPRAIEHLKSLFKKMAASVLNIQFDNDISIIHENK